MGLDRADTLVPVVGKHVDGRTNTLIISEWDTASRGLRIQPSHDASIRSEVRLCQQITEPEFLEDLDRLFSDDIWRGLLLRNGGRRRSLDRGRLVVTLHRCSLRSLGGSLSSFVYAKVSQFPSQFRSSLTLAASPTQPNSAASDGKALHLFDCPLSIRLADELDEAAVLPSRNLDL